MSDKLQKKIDSQVIALRDADTMAGFAKANAVAQAMKSLRTLLNDEFMEPIMELQGNSLGFKTDKSYQMKDVRDCLIEAVFYGVEPTGNQFNIIAGKCYITKEGYGYLLNQLDDYEWDITHNVPRIQDKSALITMEMKYKSVSENDWTKLEPYQIPIRVNAGMGLDAVIGKATRKARKRLYEVITGKKTPDGDTEDIEFTVVEDKKKNTVKNKSSLAEEAAKSMINTGSKKEGNQGAMDFS
jgi:hypothetical protein